MTASLVLSLLAQASQTAPGTWYLASLWHSCALHERFGKLKFVPHRLESDVGQAVAVEGGDALGERHASDDRVLEVEVGEDFLPLGGEEVVDEDAGFGLMGCPLEDTRRGGVDHQAHLPLALVGVDDAYGRSLGLGELVVIVVHEAELQLARSHRLAYVGVPAQELGLVGDQPLDEFLGCRLALHLAYRGHVRLYRAVGAIGGAYLPLPLGVGQLED